VQRLGAAQWASLQRAVVAAGASGDGRPRLGSAGSAQSGDGEEDAETLEIVLTKRTGESLGLALSTRAHKVKRVIRDPPSEAHTCGLREGDVVTHVNGTHVADLTHDEVIRLISSSLSRVALRVLRRLRASRRSKRDKRGTTATATVTTAGDGSRTQLSGDVEADAGPNGDAPSVEERFSVKVAKGSAGLGINCRSEPDPGGGPHRIVISAISKTGVVAGHSQVRVDDEIVAINDQILAGVDRKTLQTLLATQAPSITLDLRRWARRPVTAGPVAVSPTHEDDNDIDLGVVDDGMGEDDVFAAAQPDSNAGPPLEPPDELEAEPNWEDDEDDDNVSLDGSCVTPHLVHAAHVIEYSFGDPFPCLLAHAIVPLAGRFMWHTPSSACSCMQCPCPKKSRLFFNRTSIHALGALPLTRPLTSSRMSSSAVLTTRAQRMTTMTTTVGWQVSCHRHTRHPHRRRVLQRTTRC
jgi:hypothetical protein